ncbi:MAG TPA: hypothetical protein VF141_08530 [Chryseolinea sp.]
MKRLSMGDWSVIARYLSKEASAKDEDRFALLLDRCPKLRDELEELDHALSPHPAVESSFDETGAFEKLTERFKKENLI